VRDVQSSPARSGRFHALIASPVVQRYVIGAVLVAAGLLLSVLTFELQQVRVLSRLVEASPVPLTFAGIVRPSSELTISTDAPVRIEDVLVAPGQQVTRGTPLFSVDDRDARLALPLARLEAQEAAVQVRELELGLGALERTVTELNAEYARVSDELEVAARRAATIPTPQLRDSTERAQAAYDLAQLTLDRARRLHAVGAVARQELDDAEAGARIAGHNLDMARRAEAAYTTVAATETSRAALRAQLAAAQETRARAERSAALARARIRYERAAAGLAALERRLAQAQVTAPSDGTVGDVRVSRGDLVTAGAVLARMADLNRLVVDVQMPSAQIPLLSIGSTVQLTINAVRELRREGTVRSIEPTPGPNGTHRVTVEFANPGGVILSGQPASVSIAG
jgi:multidrug resistance efflux pump